LSAAVFSALKVLPAVLLLLSAAPALGALDVACEWPGANPVSGIAESTDVMATPVVGDLDGDGLPEIVIITFVDVNDNNRGQDGVLRVLSGADCTELFSIVDPGPVQCFGDAAPRSLEERADPGVFCPGCGVAIADLDDDGDMEIVVMAEGLPRPSDAEPDDFRVGYPRRTVIFDHEGNFVSCSEASTQWIGHVAAPAIADLEADGEPEIVVRTSVFNVDGSLAWAAPTTGWGPSAIADLDDDGLQEVIAGETAYRSDGSILWERADLNISFPAVADMNGDCIPEVVLTAPRPAEVHVLNGQTGDTLALLGLPGGLDVCAQPRPNQGGAPTLADIDGDFIPEIGIAGCLNYTVFQVDDDGMGNITGLTQLWTNDISDNSSRITGSTYFDLEGDGNIEVLYQDQERLWIYDAATGATIDTFEHSNSTLIEYPALADVDADGQAEVVIVGNDYFRCCDIGIKVLHDLDQPWTPTRALLNQHAYHQTNVNDDGTIPVREEPSWQRNNNYRAQLVPNSPQRDDCAPPPMVVCDPQGSYEANCAVNAECDGGVEVVLEAAESPPIGPAGPTYTWTIDCAGDVQVLDGRSVVACVPVTCEGCLVELLVSEFERNASDTCETRIDWIFDEPPLTIDGGPDRIVDCPVLDPPYPRVTAACDPAPSWGLDETVIDGPCEGTFTIVDRFHAIDACGNLVEDEVITEVVDTTPPTLERAPADVTLQCGELEPVATLTAVDDCTEPVVSFEEVRVDGSCPDNYQLVRTWTASDGCDNAVTERQVVSYEDTTAPDIFDVPPDETVPCGGVPEAVTPRVIDRCDPAPLVDFVETILPGSCPHSYDVVRTWTATDRCGNVNQASRTIMVRDMEPPVLTVPPPLVLECEGDGGLPIDDPLIQAWLRSALATDDCTDPVVVSWDAPDFFPVGCPDPAPQLVTFFAEDECGNAVSATSTIEVVDTTPPVIVATDLPGCLWSPNHMYACFPDVSEFVTAVDACGGEVAIRVEGCESDQPDEAPEDGDRGGKELGNGDGHTYDDCIVAPDGSGVCARFERQGTDRDGRNYAISIVVSDDCGNAVVVPWDLHVPHDQRDHPCPNAKRVNKIGKNEPFPWEE
jgi:hypothetical protein